MREEEGCSGLLATGTCRPGAGALSCSCPVSRRPTSVFHPAQGACEGSGALTSTGLLPGAGEGVQELSQVWGQIARVTGTREGRNSWMEGQTASRKGTSLASCDVL